jgi:hypothetical protein
MVDLFGLLFFLSLLLFPLVIIKPSWFRFNSRLKATFSWAGVSFILFITFGVNLPDSPTPIQKEVQKVKKSSDKTSISLQEKTLPSQSAEQLKDPNKKTNHDTELLKFKLIEYIDTVQSLYGSNSMSFKKFSQIKKKLENKYQIICDDYEGLVEQTGNMNSLYFQAALDCKEVTLSMMGYLFGIRDGNKKNKNLERKRVAEIASRYK